MLIGKHTVDLAPLRGRPNIHLLGPRPYATLPRYCRGFDAAIIPFRLDELTVRANPLKLREYLAAGLPVVSTPMPEVVRYDGLVRFAHDANGFVTAIEEELRRHDPHRQTERVELMTLEGWESRVEQLSAWIGQALAGEAGGLLTGPAPERRQPAPGAPLRRR